LYKYDGDSRLVEQVQNYVEGGAFTSSQNVTTRYSYDSLGNVQTVTDPLGHVTYICYDKFSRPSRYIRNYLGSPYPCADHFDPVDNTDQEIVTTLRYDSNGNLTDVFYDVN